MRTRYRILRAGVAGGLVLFAWGAVWHALLGMDKLVAQEVSDDTAIGLALGRELTAPGLYTLPKDVRSTSAAGATPAWRAVIAFDPTGGSQKLITQLILQLAGDLGAALVAAIILVHIKAGILMRAFLVVGIGIAAWLSVDLPYWVWHSFPAVLVSSHLCAQTIGWLLAGIAMVLLPRTPRELSAETAPQRPREY